MLFARIEGAVRAPILRVFPFGARQAFDVDPYRVFKARPATPPNAAGVLLQLRQFVDRARRHVNCQLSRVVGA
jgi:hypothetical protein